MKNNLYKNILEQISLPVCVFNKEGNIIFSNNSFKEISQETNIKNIKNQLTGQYTIQKENEYEILIVQPNNQSHADFISTVSHELRTPLTSIRGFADTMLMSADKLTKEQNNKFLTIIRNQADRLTRLVENLLEVSNLSQKNKIILKEINFEKFINPIVTIFERKYSKQKFNLQISKNLPYLWADNDMLEQIMTNLLDNASKYSPENSTIILDASYKNDNIIIQIIDNAQQIPESELENIFNKFSRIDSPLTRKVEGSGLGLYITKTLTEKMQGTIKATNYDNGNIFTLTLPASSVEKQLEQKIKGDN